MSRLRSNKIKAQESENESYFIRVLPHEIYEMTLHAETATPAQYAVSVLYGLQLVTHAKYQIAPLQTQNRYEATY